MLLITPSGLCTLQLNAVVYVGDGRSREVIRAFEFGGTFTAPGCNPASSNRSRPYSFEVLITTYELALKDAALLGKINWAFLMVDEAHRLKNSESALYQVCFGGIAHCVRPNTWEGGNGNAGCLLLKLPPTALTADASPYTNPGIMQPNAAFTAPPLCFELD